jgi:hypothetical protein
MDQINAYEKPKKVSGLLVEMCNPGHFALLFVYNAPLTSCNNRAHAIV